MAMAIVLPISFFMDPLIGIPFLIGVYKGGIFGGSIPAILVSLPGTGASVATTFDGPPLTKMGKGRKALETALFSSVIADFSSDIVTILLIGPIALIALLIGPPELAAILFLSILIISSTSSGSVGKNMIMLATGLFIAMIGQDPIAALSRFTFDVFEGENIPKDKKSVAINVTLQALDKTLSEKDLDQVSQKIIEVVKEKTGATIRS